MKADGNTYEMWSADQKSKDKNEPKVVTNPTHDTIKKTIANFIKQII